MAQPAKAQEPTMEEILASIRRIIADDDASKPGGAEPPAKAAAPKPAPPPPAPKSSEPNSPASSSPKSPAAELADAAGMSQDDIDAMLAGIETAAAEAAPDTDATPDVLELTEAMAAPAAETPALHRIDSSPDIVFAEEPVSAPPPTHSPPSRQSLTPRPAAAEPQPAPILSQRTTAAVDAAFNSLAHTVLVQNAKTLEDLVKEMLRPMLKSWLDDNLPTLVERLVRAEIERVSRGR
jgi:cell pole-organizing protein PopZ